MPVKTTLKEIAQILELSPSTISKALNNSPEISSGTKRRVRKLAKAYGYVPNHMAQSLKSKKTKSIGVVVPNVIDDFFGKVLHGIVEEASTLGYTVLVTFSNDRKSHEDKNLQGLLGHSVDGILISFSKETQLVEDYGAIEAMDRYGVPVVMFDRVNKTLPFDSVSLNDFQGAYQATKYLIASKCSKIAFLSPISNTSVGRSRRNGYTAALLEAEKGGLKPDYWDIVTYENFKGFLAEKWAERGFDAILAADELSAIYALNTVHQLGLGVPMQVSVIGFTDGPMAESANPPLSTVSQHAESIGRRALRMLIRRIKNEGTAPSHSTIKPELVLRGTTKGQIM